MPAPARALPLVVLLLASACAERREAPTVAPHIDAFAKTYIAALKDSAVAAVTARTKGSTAEIPGFGDGVIRMRALLPTGVVDTVALREAESFRVVDEPPTTRLVYRVRGGYMVASVELWVEEPAGKPLVVETVRVSPAEP